MRPHLEAKPGQDLLHPLMAHREAGEAMHIGGVEVDGGDRGQGLARHLDVGRFAAAELQDQLRRQFQAGDHEARIDAAGEAVLGV